MSRFSECGTPDLAVVQTSSELSKFEDLRLDASVGHRGVNQRSDVLLVQTALNLVPQKLGGPLASLAVDGLSGPKTEKAIYGFQVHHFGAAKADARIDPGLRTLAALDSAVAERSEANAARQKITAAIPVAILWIMMAKKSLALSAAFLNGATSSENEKNSNLVDRCFKLRTVNNIEAKKSIRHVTDVFDRMIPAIFQLQTFSQIKPVVKCKPGANATAVVGGFQSKHPNFKKITYCPARIEKKDVNDVADILVHELAHYCGPLPPSPKAISHGGVVPPAYKLRAFTLSHRQSLISASNYSWLAFLARLPSSQWLTHKG